MIVSFVLPAVSQITSIAIKEGNEVKYSQELALTQTKQVLPVRLGTRCTTTLYSEHGEQSHSKPAREA